MPATKDALSVWVVDDDPDDQYLVQLLFRQLSPAIGVKTMSDGGELLTCLEQADSLPTLVLLDLNMPLMNGFEVLNHVRANPIYQALPIVMLTTSDSPEDRAKAMQLGANDYLSKPLDVATFNSVVSQLPSSTHTC